MTSIETLTGTLSAAVLAAGLAVALVVAIGEIWERRRQRSEQFNSELMDLLDELSAASAMQEEPTDARDRRRRLVERAQSAFDGVLTRDLARSAALAEAFEFVVRELRSMAPSTTPAPPEPQ